MKFGSKFAHVNQYVFLRFLGLVISSIVVRECSLQMLDGSLIECLSEAFVGSPSVWLTFLFWEDALVHHLFFHRRIFVNFLIFSSGRDRNFLETLGLAKSLIQHFLIVTYESHFSSKSFVPVVLRLTKNVVSLLERSSMWFPSFWVIIDSFIWS